MRAIPLLFAANSTLDEAASGIMDVRVVGARHYHEVFRAVVGIVAVYVVDNLV